jgi:hypothetical protein
VCFAVAVDYYGDDRSDRASCAFMTPMDELFGCLLTTGVPRNNKRVGI